MLKRNKIKRQNSLDLSSPADQQIRSGSTGEKLAENLKRPLSGLFSRKTRKTSSPTVEQDGSKNANFPSEANVFVVKNGNAENWIDENIMNFNCESNFDEHPILDRSLSVKTHYDADNVVVWNPATDETVENEKHLHQELELPRLAQPPDEFNRLDYDFHWNDVQDVLALPIFAIDKDINLHILTKHISPTVYLRDERNVWSVDYLLTNLLRIEDET